MLRVFLYLSVIVIFAVSLSPGQNSQIAGIVFDSLSQEPLAGANIILVGTRMGTSTDANGRFILARLDSGSHTLRVTFIGYTSTERTVVLSAGDSVSLSVLLKPEQLETQVVVVTGTRTLRSIADVPVRVEAIPEEEVEEKLLMTPSTVAMLLNESTGMRVQITSAAANTANLRIQGLSGRYTQILNDGIPSLGGLSAGLSLTQLVPLDLRQVEILKGATSSLYGADAIAGVVNFLPKVPGEVVETSLLVNGTTQNGFDVAGYSSHRFGETGLSILASHNRQARYDVDGDGFADVAQFTRTTVTPRILHRFSDRLSFRLGLSFLDEERIGGAVNETPRSGASSPPYTERMNTNRFETSTHFDWTPSKNQTLSVKLALLLSDRDAFFGVFPFHATQRVSFADAQYSLDLPSHKLLLGAGFRIDDFEDRTAGIPARSYRFAVPSVLLQDEFHVSNDVTAVMSGRLDFHDTFGTFFVPRFSVMYRPTSSLTLRLGGGTGYKAPTIFVEEAEEVGFRNVRPLMNVRPEKAQSASLDLNWRSILGSFTADCNVALFHTNLDDALLADEDSLRADVIYLRNATGPTSSIGGEFSARLTYEDFKMSFGYTYLYATQEDNAHVSEIELNPRHSVGIVAIWENDEHQLKMGLENYWTGRQRVIRNPFRTTTPPYWITGFIVEKGFGNFRLFINLENIFDTRQTRYEPIFIGDPAGGTIRTLPVYAPLEGRVINAGVRYVLKSTHEHRGSANHR
jgi:outer membrane receptor for ferrienterochelin and colicins